MITTYRQFNSYIRSLDCNNPRQVNGVLTKLFPDIIPEDNIPTNLNEWSQHDKYSVLSYFMLAREMNQNTTDKFKQNYKASKVMLIDLERGRNMLSETSKQISYIQKECQESSEEKYQVLKTIKLAEKQKESQMSVSKAPFSKTVPTSKSTKEVKVKTEKEVKPVKEKKVTKVQAVCPLITEQKLTDSQIAEKASKLYGKEIKLGDISLLRNDFNKGRLTNCAEGYPAPKTPYVEIISKEDLKALAQTGKKAEAKKETVKPEVKPVSKPVAKPEAKASAPAVKPVLVKKIVPVKAK